MLQFKCYDVLEPVLKEATKQFAPVWVQDKESTKILQQYCSVIDSFMEEFGASGITAEVNDEDLTVHITMECDDMVLEEKNHLFYQIMMRSISVRFSAAEENNLNVEFIFPGIWERA